MRKEIVVHIYLFIFYLFFSFFKLFPLKRKSIFIVYLGYNALYSIEALERKSNEPIVICYSKSTQVRFKQANNRTLILNSTFRVFNWIRMVYHLATSDNVVVDNYYAFLAKSNFKEGVLCIQLWHAAGAMKKFALLDNSLSKRPSIAKKRFEQAYNRFTHVIVGAEEMGDIFCQCFGIEGNKILYTGIPRTDLFYSSEKQAEAKRRLFKSRPELENVHKKVLLYAPTFRDEQMTVSESALNIEELYKELKDDYVLFLKTHPAVKNKVSNKFTDFVYDLSEYSSVNDLLLITDVLVTDYSSIPFEFSFLNRPMIFYAYDLEDYSKNRGTWKDYKSSSPGPVAHTTEEVIDFIKSNTYDYRKIEEFKRLWNRYSDGTSSDKLIEFVLKNRVFNN